MLYSPIPYAELPLCPMPPTPILYLLVFASVCGYALPAYATSGTARGYAATEACSTELGMLLPGSGGGGGGAVRGHAARPGHALPPFMAARCLRLWLHAASVNGSTLCGSFLPPFMAACGLWLRGES
eukprot:3348887-Rhodomonas_salina.2